MSLADRITSGATLISGYSVQPYKAVTDTTAFGNRFMSPVVAAPAVADIAFETAPVGSRTRGTTKQAKTAGVQTLRNGAAAASGNLAPRRGR